MASRFIHRFLGSLVIIAIGVMLMSPPPDSRTARASAVANALESDDPPEAAEEQEPAPPKGQEYIGVKKCAACHFDQFMKWKKTKHATSFEALPAKYQKDDECLKCHTTGFGEPTGYKTAADVDLKGTSCETCHGPGSKHAEIAKPFANKKLTAEQEKVVRDSIWKMLPKNVCVSCHMVQGHHDSMTPAELRKK